MNITGLQRFVRSVPQLRALLTAGAASTDELLLRNELRRIARELSDRLDEAAEDESDHASAAVLRGASLLAADIGVAPLPLVPAARDH
jgi:hypothetical protein